MSMIGGYLPPMMEIAQDTMPELAPVFNFLNAHSNKLYQEGYFLKLNDLDIG
jgi:CCR4-NOT transcriptional complex subunit CAF120